jgi:hypothetical protein
MSGGNLPLQVYETKADFADIRLNLIDAIIDRGYVIDFNGSVGNMLKRTREDVGGKPIYRDAEYMTFCSAVLSRNTMEADARNIGYCPYVLTVYENIANPGTIYVSYRKLSSSKNTDQSLLAVDKMLDEIAREAVD